VINRDGTDSLRVDDIVPCGMLCVPCCDVGVMKFNVTFADAYGLLAFPAGTLLLMQLLRFPFCECDLFFNQWWPLVNDN